jgi:uncharacterized protein
MREEINSALKAAMKSGDKTRLSTLRLVNAAIKDRDIALRGEGKGPASDDDLMSLLQKMIKQRDESAEVYTKGGRPELATQERDEAEVIREFLPQQMEEEAVSAAIAEIIAREGASSIKDLGKVMAALKAAYAGRMDFARASAVAKGMLT